MSKKLIGAVLVVVIVFGGSLLTDSLRGAGEVEKEKLALKVAREMLRGAYKLVSVDELKAWFDQNKDMLVVDTMPYNTSYRKNHIPGAKQFLFPIEEMTEMEQTQQERFAELLGPDKAKPIVFYCGFVKCPRSHNAAMWAVNLGYQNVYRCPGGIVAWKGAGYPVSAE